MIDVILFELKMLRIISIFSYLSSALLHTCFLDSLFTLYWCHFVKPWGYSGVDVGVVLCLDSKLAEWKELLSPHTLSFPGIDSDIDSDWFLFGQFLIFLFCLCWRFLFNVFQLFWFSCFLGLLPSNRVTAKVILPQNVLHEMVHYVDDHENSKENPEASIWKIIVSNVSLPKFKLTWVVTWDKHGPCAHKKVCPNHSAANDVHLRTFHSSNKSKSSWNQDHDIEAPQFTPTRKGKYKGVSDRSNAESSAGTHVQPNCL